MIFTGKVGLVTGGAQGIGRALVEGLLKRGAKVSFLDINKDVGQNTTNELENEFGEGNIMFCHCDVGNLTELEECFKKTVDKFGKLDVVVNNAGVVNEEYPGWTKCININVCGVIRGTELGINYMSKSKGHDGGTVINISSLASLDAFAPVPVYSATKAFINQFTRSHGTEDHFRITGVKVAALLPGITDTPMIKQSPSLVIQDLRQLWNDLNDCLVPQKQGWWINSLTKNPDILHRDTDNLAEALEMVVEKAENGSLWSVSDDKPPVRVELRGQLL